MAEFAAAHEEITPIPTERRTISWFGTGVLWGDLSVGLLVFAAGSLLILTMDLRTAIIATVVGSLIGSILLAIVGRAGSDVGVPTMVLLRPALGIRGSYVASLMNIAQLIGWAGLEIIIMAQASRALSDEFFGFEGYYLWLTAFAVLATGFAVAGPIVVVRDFLQRFGVWIVIAATAWLSYRLFSTYDIQDMLRSGGDGGQRDFWRGVDLVVSLPVSWLPLVADYSRYARRAAQSAWATLFAYTLGNIWFFALGASYALVLAGGPVVGNDLIYGLVDSLLPLTLGWIFLFVILTDETDNAFANVYSTAVSLQNLVKLSYRLLAIVVGVAAFIFAVSFDLLGYETFLLLIGGTFVSLFGVLIVDYFVANNRAYEASELYAAGGRYWYWNGLNVAGLLAWAAGFATYIVAGQPPWVVEHFPRIADVPSDLTAVGGTLPSFVVSTLLYLALHRLFVAGQPRPRGEAAYARE